MKTFVKYIAFAAMTAVSASILPACSEDKVYEVDVNAIPLASDYADAIIVDVDDATNNVTFTFNAKGVYPVWIVDGKSYSTAHSMTRFYRKAGEYQIEVKVGNANGISQGAIAKSFTISKTQMSGFGGFVYDSPFNMWITATKQINSFFYAPAWSQLPDPAHSFNGDEFKISLPQATTDQWQCQAHIGSDICLEEGEAYDGSFIFTATMDINNVTLKIHPDGDDDDSHSFFCNQKINLTAGEPKTFWFHELVAAVPMNNLVFTFDFGGNPEGIEITVENFVIKKSSDDDGTIIPDLPTEAEPSWVAVDSPENLWNAANFTNAFYYAPGWSQIADPVVDVDGHKYTIGLPAATFETWQAQVMFNTELKAEDTAALYDFKVTFESNTDLPGVMVKLVQSDEPDTKHDGNFFFAESIAVPANSPTTFWMSKVSAPEAMHAITLVLDFGGNPEGTEVKVSDIIFQVHHD